MLKWPSLWMWMCNVLIFCQLSCNKCELAIICLIISCNVNIWIPSISWKWPLTIMINGWCHEMSTNEIHSQMDHSWKWPLNIIISRFITKVVNVHNVHTCWSISTFLVYSYKKYATIVKNNCNCICHFQLKSSWKICCKWEVFLLMSLG
jgi:hypothetical protein